MKKETVIENGIEYQVKTNSGGSKYWFQNGERHRLDGPACEWADGSKAWYINGIQYTENEWKIEIEKINRIKKLEEPMVDRFENLLNI